MKTTPPAPFITNEPVAFATVVSVPSCVIVKSLPVPILIAPLSAISRLPDIPTFLNEDISLLESATTALLAVTVPAVNPSSCSKSASFILAEPIIKLPVAVTLPVTPSAPVFIAAAVKDTLPVASPVAVVVPTTNASADSSHKNAALSPVEPRSMIKPMSLALEPAPVLSSIIVSETLLFVVLTVVVVPFTVKLPVIVNAPPIVTLSGKAMLILLSDTVVAISFAVPSNVNVFVPTVTVSFDPLSAAIVNVLALLIFVSTYAFVAAS